MKSLRQFLESRLRTFSSHPETQLNGSSLFISKIFFSQPIMAHPIQNGRVIQLEGPQPSLHRAVGWLITKGDEYFEAVKIPMVSPSYPSPELSLQSGLFGLSCHLTRFPQLTQSSCPPVSPP